MPPAAADRNLLFGILALQMDFIDRDGLVTAMNAWVLDKAKPLGQILLQQGKLAAADYELLEGLVQRHLERHGHDAERSLAALLVRVVAENASIHAVSARGSRASEPERPLFELNEATA